MKFLAVAAALIGAVAAGAHGNVTYTTEVVTEYTTYCPASTTLTYGDKTYTITEATTLTITDCPCTISKPVYTSIATGCAGGSCGYGNKTTTFSTGGYTAPTAATSTNSPVQTGVTAGAGKIALSGLAGVVAIAFAL